MRTSETLTKIGPAIVAALGEIENPPLDGKNPHFKSKYTKIQTILKLVRPVLAEHGLAVLQSTAEGPSVSTMLMHESGEWVESDPVVMSPGKKDPQGIMGALTYARRGSLCAMLGIAGDDDDDGNIASRPAPPKPKAGPRLKELADRVGERIKRELMTKEEYKDHLVCDYNVDTIKNLSDEQIEKEFEWLDEQPPF